MKVNSIHTQVKEEGMFIHQGLRDGLKSFSKMMLIALLQFLMAIIIQPDNGKKKQKKWIRISFF